MVPNKPIAGAIWSLLKLAVIKNMVPTTIKVTAKILNISSAVAVLFLNNAYSALITIKPKKRIIIESQNSRLLKKLSWDLNPVPSEYFGGVGSELAEALLPSEVVI